MTLVHYCNNQSQFNTLTAPLDAARRTIEKHLSGQTEIEGFCTVCNEITKFEVFHDPGNGWTNLRESIVCSGCKLNGRHRLSFDLLVHSAKELGARKVHIMERLTPFYATAAAQGLPINGSEYCGPDFEPGSMHLIREIEIQHEDMHNLSFGDASLDIVGHFDVLEHVADYRRALSECARVLRPRGEMIFTVPFFGHDKHQIRAEVVDGALMHHLPPAYHKNPMSQEGSLVFFIPGWPLLDELRALGFASARIGLCYDPFQGIVSDNNPHADWLMWPVIFRAVKA